MLANAVTAYTTKQSRVTETCK